MKVKAASLKKVGDESATFAGGFLGAAAARGASGLIGENTMIKAGLAVAGIVLAASVTGTDTGAKMAKGAGLGIALEQGTEVILDLVQPLIAPVLDGEASALKDFGKKAFGLAGAYGYPMEYIPQEMSPARALGNPYARGADERGNGQSTLMFS